MPLPTPRFATTPETFATPWGERECDQREKPGVAAFARFVTKHQGGVSGGILRPCGGGKSGHTSGRAWDWMIDALEPESRARADELIAWLLANDAEMFRRVGLRYLIWDKKLFTSRSAKWGNYDGFSAQGTCPSPPCRNPHTNHVHFSFGKPGADGETSFFKWLDRGDYRPPGPDPTPTQAAPAGMGWAVFGAISAFAAVSALNRLR